MKYRLSKQKDNGRLFHAGIVLPDGFYRIMSLTRTNHVNLEKQMGRGYLIEELPDDYPEVCGIYTEDGARCTEKSVYEAMGVGGQGWEALVHLKDKDPVDDATAKLGLSDEQLKALSGRGRGNRPVAKTSRRVAGQEIREGNTLADLKASLGALGVNIPSGWGKREMEIELEKQISRV